MEGDEVRTRTGRMRFEVGGDRFVVVAGGHVGPSLVRADLDRAARFGSEHGAGWWYVVDTSAVRLPNPANVRYLRRIRRLPGLAGYVLIAPRAPLRTVARLLGGVSRPDAVVRSRGAAERFITRHGEPDSLPLFLYDGDCGFCRKWAAWLERRAAGSVRFRAFQTVPALGRFGLAPAELSRASYLVDEDDRPHRGSAGFAEALKRSRGLWPLAGYAMEAPGIRRLAAAVYEVVTRNRHRLPAPAVPDPRQPDGGPGGGDARDFAD